ncbi:MAG: hypothetical protein L0323_08410 [Planctomycetes bacterium]|nr:hypothetical protein [Planctomycetota bacterium]
MNPAQRWILSCFELTTRRVGVEVTLNVFVSSGARPRSASTQTNRFASAATAASGKLSFSSFRHQGQPSDVK